MWREIKILLIDDDHQRRHDMQVILDFLGEEVIVSDSQHWQEEVNRRAKNSQDISAVLVGDDSRGLFHGVMTAVYQWDKSAPIICLGRDHGLDCLRTPYVAR